MEAEDISPLEAAKRELLEETGYASEHFLETGILSPNSANHSNITHCFLATDVEYVANSNLDSTEQINVVLLPLEKVIELISNGGILQALHVCSLFFALQKLSKVQL